MTKVIDYAWSSGFAGAAAIKAAGFDGVMRYLSHDASKDLSGPERDDLLAHGLSIGLVFESTANRASEGTAAGAADATFANDRADALGYPLDCELRYAVDFDAMPQVVQAYFDGVASVKRRPSSPYGGFKVIDGVTYPGRGWQTVAWSGGKVSTRAALIQNGFHQSYDSNDVLVANYGQWTSPTQGDSDLTPDQAKQLDDVWHMLADADVDYGGSTLNFIWLCKNAIRDIKLETDVLTAHDSQNAAVDVDKLAAALSKTLGADVAKALGQKLSA